MAAPQPRFELGPGAREGRRNCRSKPLAMLPQVRERPAAVRRRDTGGAGCDVQYFDVRDQALRRELQCRERLCVEG